MKLRTKLLALSLLTLLLPWSAWKLLQELESFLREAQEETLLAAARTMTGVIPLGFQTRLLFLPETYLPLRELERRPVLDGYGNDWPHAEHGLAFRSLDRELDLHVVAGHYRDELHLLLSIDHRGRPAGADTGLRLRLLARDPRGLYGYPIAPEAPGPLQLDSEQGAAGQIDGFWLEVPDEGAGTRYRAELSLPLAGRDVAIAVSAEAYDRATGRTVGAPAGTLSDPGRPGWIALLPAWDEVSDWLARAEVASARAWLVDKDGWVLADSGPAATAVGQATGQTTWLQRSLYRLVAGEPPEPLAEDWPRNPVRFDAAVLQRALQGEDASHWSQDPETAVVWNTVAVPVVLEQQVRGALVMQSDSEGLLLMTNRALSRLLLTTLALTLVLAASLWFFATRLSRRVRRLSGAVSRAMEDRSEAAPLPLAGDRDELGELARNNERLLRAVTDYSQYLQTLASKLSHELKTPLAITRSSLENLAERPLDDDSRQYVERAREGVERQAAIVRAMSEASRLEAAVEAAEWSRVDLGELVLACAAAYRDLYAGRRLDVRVPELAFELDCAPDLLAQALDKLVDNAMTLSGEADEVSIRVESHEDHVDLAVGNSGSRLPDELQERLFDSLVSLRPKRGEGLPHLGLGLYIVRLVAKAHGGTVHARNLPNAAGVEFRLRLPL